MLTARIKGIYMHDHGKIILFNNQSEVQNFVGNFINYSMGKALQEGLNVIEVMSAGNEVKIEEWTEALANSATCGTINFKDLKK